MNELQREQACHETVSLALPLNLTFCSCQVHEVTLAHGAYPSPYNYYNFPKSVCTSVNEVICHGIPDRRPLQNGDIVNVDISVYYKGGRVGHKHAVLSHCINNCPTTIHAG